MTAPRTIVTGGTGLVGRFIVEALLGAGRQVTVAGRTAPRPGFFSAAVAFAPLDLDAAVPARLFDGADELVHAALDHQPGRYRGGEGGDADGFRRRNLDGSKALFAAARASGVGRAVFLSTRAVYGPRPPGAMLDEADECRPDTLYGAVKLAAEDALAALSGAGFAGVSLRVTGVYGPAGPGRAHKWAGLFDDFRAGRPVAARAATEVHGRDVAAAVKLMLSAPDSAVSGRVFNVCDLVLDRRDLLALVARQTGIGSALPPAAERAAVNAMRTERLRALGWRPGGMALLAETVRELVGGS